MAVTGGTTTLSTTAIFSNFAGTTGGGIWVAIGGTATFLNSSIVQLNHPNNCVGTSTCPA